MIKWIGQHIVDLIARFRSDVYLENIDSGTIASGSNLGLDSNNKIVKADVPTGDINQVSFTSDSGSFGITTGDADFTISGGEGINTSMSTSTITLTAAWADNENLNIGTGNDFNAFHDGTDTYLSNENGDLYIRSRANDKDIIFQSDDGSGGVAEYFKLDGSLADGSNYYTKWPDNSIASFGSAPDLFIYHDGFNSRIRQLTTSDLIIENLGDDKDIIFKCDDGSGGVQTYLTIDGGLESVIVPDTIYLAAGGGLDLSLRHDGSNSHIQNNTGDLTIKNTANDKDIIFQSDDGSGGLTDYLTLDGSSGYTKAHKHILYEDNAKAMFGTGGDMQILHDGSNSYISQNVTGNLYIENNATDGDVVFRSDDGSGGTTEYFRVDGSSVANVFSEKIEVYKADASANPRVSIGRSSGEAINFDVEDRTARIYHKQDETTGSHVLKLTVDSDTSDTKDIHLGFRDADGSNESIKFTVDESGNVGIGTTSPSEKLEVDGNIAVSGSVQRQISTTHHTFTFGAAGSASQDYWICLL